MNKIITPDTPQTSEPFSIGPGTQLTLMAEGLQGTDRVLIELVATTSGGPLPTECCPGQVVLPEVKATSVLRCRNGARAILTAAHPWLVLDAPQDVEMQARVEADDLALITVKAGSTASQGCAVCQCVEPYCPSLPLEPRGYAFAPGDEIDPDATVGYAGGFVYPTPREGATVAVLVAGLVVGYARNKSECAEPLRAASGASGSVVTALSVSADGQVTLAQSGGPAVVSNNPNPCI